MVASNELAAVPVEPGDRRSTIIDVSEAGEQFYCSIQVFDST
jgi:hypothetical protein